MITLAAPHAGKAAKVDPRMALFYLGLLPILGVIVAVAIPEPPKE